MAYGKTGSDEKIEFLTDEEEGYLIVIDSVHNEVHEGEMFHTNHIFSSVANGGNADTMLHTLDGEYHTMFSVSVGGAVDVFLYEDVVVTDSGTAVTSYNMNRTSTKESDLVVTHTPTVSSTGTTLVSKFIPGGSSQQTRIGGDTRTATEWLLKPNTNYMIRINNVSGTTIRASISIEFYKHQA